MKERTKKKKKREKKVHAHTHTQAIHTEWIHVHIEIFLCSRSQGDKTLATKTTNSEIIAIFVRLKIPFALKLLLKLSKTKIYQLLEVNLHITPLRFFPMLV